MAKPGDYLTLEKFLAMQAEDTVIADPLLNAVSSVHTPDAALQTYCKQHAITHVMGVRVTPDFTKHAATIAENACTLANEVAKKLHLVTLNLITSTVLPGTKMHWKFIETRNYFYAKGTTPELEKLKAIFEKTFRFPDEMDMAAGTLSGAPMIRIKMEALKLDLARTLAIADFLIRPAVPATAAAASMRPR